MSTKLGSKVVDMATGAVGIATARCEYWKGSVMILFEFPPSAPGKKCEEQWVNEGRTTHVVEDEPAVVEPSVAADPALTADLPK